MLSALPKTIWLRFNTIWANKNQKTSTTYMETQSVQQQKMHSHEAYSQVRRNMY